MIVIGKLLRRLDFLIEKGKNLTKEEEREKSTILMHELDEKLRAFIPVTHGFLSNSAEGNRARTSLYKMARYALTIDEKEKEKEKEREKERGRERDSSASSRSISTASVTTT